jgi:hypothetical protein
MRPAQNRTQNEINLKAIRFSVNNFLKYLKLRTNKVCEGSFNKPIGNSKDLYEHLNKAVNLSNHKKSAFKTPKFTTEIQKKIVKRKSKLRERKSRAKFIPNPKACRRRVIKLVDKIKSWKTLKYKKVIDHFWKKEETLESVYEDEESVFSLQSLDFSEDSSN